MLFLKKRTSARITTLAFLGQGRVVTDLGSFSAYLGSCYITWKAVFGWNIFEALMLWIMCRVALNSGTSPFGTLAHEAHYMLAVSLFWRWSCMYMYQHKIYSPYTSDYSECANRHAFEGTTANIRIRTTSVSNIHDAVIQQFILFVRFSMFNVEFTPIYFTIAEASEYSIVHCIYPLIICSV